MMRKISGTVLVGGCVGSVSIEGGKAVVSFSGDTPAVMEFTGTSNRADKIKKMRLHAGEKVVAIGGINGSHIYGWELYRNGAVSKKKYTLIKGKIAKTSNGSSSGMLEIETDQKKYHISYKGNTNFVAGDTVICMCHMLNSIKCAVPCGKENCMLCGRRKNVKHYQALAICKA